MTDDMIALRELLEKGSDATLLREMIGFAAQRLMELETEAQAWIEQFGGFSKGFARHTFDLSTNRPKGFLYPYTAGMFGSGANMTFKTSALRLGVDLRSA